ncbi:MAG TPA: hypothetical protein VGF52_06955, partial [Tepidisphaeraceae bacterium]
MNEGDRMTGGRWMAGAGIFLSLAMIARVQAQALSAPIKPLALSLDPAEPESVYAPPAPPRPDEGINQGAVHFDLSVGYATDYVFRGIEIFNPPVKQNRSNLQINSKLSFDLGKLPHPYISVFVNYADSDPISSLEEIRPSLGADWTLRPLVLSAGQNTYLYQDRDSLETSEVFGQIKIDDSYFLHTDKPLLSPYIYAAYDYDLYNGWYYEAGISHDFVIEDTGLTFTPQASVGYVEGIQQFETRPKQKDVTGFQHYQLGL